MFTFVKLKSVLSIRYLHKTFTFGDEMVFAEKLKNWLKTKKLHFSIWLDRESHLFDSKTGQRTNLKDLPELHLNGRILEQNNRSVVKHDETAYVSHPKNWLASLSVDKKVCTEHLLLDNKETAILITKPKEQQP